MPDQFSFVAADPSSGRTKSADRRLIRSHCMQGKNKREDSRRSRREARQFTKLGTDDSPSVANKSRVPNPPGSEQMFKSNRTPIRLDVSLASSGAQSSLLSLFRLPDRTFDRIAGKANLTSTELLSNFSTFNDIKRSMYLAYMFVDYETMDQSSSEWLFHSLPFVHAIMTTTSIYKGPRCITLTKSTNFHLQRTIYHLNEELSRCLDAFREPITVYVIGVLSVIAGIHGNYTELGMHLSGLKQIVQLCGGRNFLHAVPALHFELERMDLDFVLATEEAPHFLEVGTGSTARKPCFETWDRPANSEFIDCIVDTRLVNVCQDLKHLILLINEHSARKSRLPPPIFHSVISSTQLRLLELKGDVSCITDECLRLGVLAFLTIVAFQIPNGCGQSREDVKVKPGSTKQRPYLACHLRDACQAIEPSTPHLEKILFWVLTMGAMSVFDISKEEWLVEKWAYVSNKLHPNIFLWEDAREDLDSVLWIRCVHDEWGQKLYEQLMIRSRLKKK